ncbi:hypothetical protein F5Y16DRAFT_379869 [Xylariaceae sp. FL0255]|nr:hypothetical protein F5Y16DRAFT_379869 [Xylariaceae sp. FL0255]
MHINMNDSLYLSKTAQIRASFSVESPPPEEGYSSNTPPLATYGVHDLSGRFSVASYETCPAYDSNLPTPVSVAGSPSIPEKSNRMMSPYSSHHQPPSPPESRAWNYSSGITDSTSIPVPSSGPQMMDMSTLGPSPPGSEHAPTAPTPYWGTYGVSSSDPPDMPGMAPHGIYHSSLSPQMFVRSAVHEGLQSASPYPHLGIAPTSSQAPNLHPMPSASLSDIDFEFQSSSARKTSRSQRANRAGRGARRRQHPASDSATLNGRNSYDAQADANVPPDHHNPENETDIEYLPLGPDAPEELRFLVHARCEKNHVKGKGMWEYMRSSYNKRFAVDKSKENLQMYLNRGVQQHALWPESEDRSLKAAVLEYEQRRYNEIKKIMKENGGCRVWDWNTGNIARRLVELDIEVLDDTESTSKLRRKRKSTVRKKTGGESWQPTTNGIHFESARRLTEAEEVHIRDEYGFKQEHMTPEADDTHAMLQNLPIPRNNANNQSARVARQACDQMLRHNTLYDNTVPSNAHGHYTS